jgi:hypothetical protein
VGGRGEMEEWSRERSGSCLREKKIGKGNGGGGAMRVVMYD